MVPGGPREALPGPECRDSTERLEGGFGAEDPGECAAACGTGLFTIPKAKGVGCRSVLLHRPGLWGQGLGDFGGGGLGAPEAGISSTGAFGGCPVGEAGPVWTEGRRPARLGFCWLAPRSAIEAVVVVHSPTNSGVHAQAGRGILHDCVGSAFARPQIRG